MSDSDCSNCGEEKCPFRKRAYYNCRNTKVIAAKELPTEFVIGLINIKKQIKKLNNDSNMYEELDNLQFVIDEILQLRKEKTYIRK